MIENPNALPSLAERTTRAGNATDLTVDPDRSRPIDVILAAGLSPSAVGRYLDQLVSEWDGAVRPRRLREAEIHHLAAQLPRLVIAAKKGKPEQVLDITGAKHKAAVWYEQERRRTVERLKTVEKLTNPHRGLIAWLAAKGVQVPSSVLVDVLCWYVDRRCPTCSGTKWATAAGTGRQTGKACVTCQGSGDAPVPHGRLGKDVAWFLDDCADRARTGQKAALRNMRNVKNWAAGKVL